MDEELEVLRGYVESLGLHEKQTINESDKSELVDTLRDADEDTLANHIEQLENADALKELITDTLYG